MTLFLLSYNAYNVTDYNPLLLFQIILQFKLFLQNKV